MIKSNGAVGSNGTVGWGASFVRVRTLLKRKLPTHTPFRLQN